MGLLPSVYLSVLVVLSTISCAQAQSGQLTPKPEPDTIAFSNGELLTGKLLRFVDGKVVFHSETLGDVTVPIAKVKTLRTHLPFALIDRELVKNGRHEGSFAVVVSHIPLGNISLDDNVVHLDGHPAAYPITDTEYLVDEATFHREVRGEANLFYGWNGSVTLGASVVDGTNKSETYNGGLSLARALPAISWLPPTSRYTLNLSGSYGLLTQPEIVSGSNVIQTASSAKTDILHGDTEYDKYLSPRFFALVNGSADHNYGSGLQLQQTYGGGFGWTVLKASKQDFDLKADLHYQQQQFYNGTSSGLGTPNENLIGADLTEAWNWTFAHGIKFNEFVTATPAFNVFRAYSGVANLKLQFPLYKRLSFSLSSTDNYLADPPFGYQRNTFQLTAGITYALK